MRIELIKKRYQYTRRLKTLITRLNKSKGNERKSIIIKLQNLASLMQD